MIKKIKSQKNAAIFLIIGSVILLISYVNKLINYGYNLNNCIITVGLLVLTICGFVGLKNSLRKEKKQNLG